MFCSQVGSQILLELFYLWSLYEGRCINDFLNGSINLCFNSLILSLQIYHSDRWHGLKFYTKIRFSALAS